METKLLGVVRKYSSNEDKECTTYWTSILSKVLSIYLSGAMYLVSWYSIKFRQQFDAIFPPHQYALQCFTVLLHLNTTHNSPILLYKHTQSLKNIYIFHH